MMLVEMFSNFFLKSYLLGCFQKFNLSKITPLYGIAGIYAPSG